MFAAAEAFQEIIVRLSVLRYIITANTKRQKTDIATDAEDFFAGFLNRLWNSELVNLNVLEQKNHPAIDLGDRKRRLAIQVTAENTIDKIRDTVESFYENDLRKKYDELIILILSRKLQYSTDIAALGRDLVGFHVWDLDDLLFEVERQSRLDEIYDTNGEVIKKLESFTRRELPAIVRALSLDEDRKVNSLLRELEVVVGHPPASARAFLEWYGAYDGNEVMAASQEIRQFYAQLKDRSYVGNRQILVHVIQSSQTAEEFRRNVGEHFYDHISEQTLVIYPDLSAINMRPATRRSFWDQLTGLQFLGWAEPMQDARYWRISLYMKSLDGNIFYLLKQFLQNDIEKLYSVLVDLDFRHLD